MFNSLLGSKFSKKCKYCLKCISSRVQLIRKKRQATVRCLKKDVAELLASGHDSKAFARIEALIVEINHASCYDMIEQYGQCILNQLSGLQKQRECPEGAMEAISTLIFAAARFSDLPELSDLRQVFRERYGSQMESSVDALFVEKVQKKSFSMNKKLQLMQDIADEFSVRWDSQAFRQKQSNPNAPPLDQPKRSSNNNSAVNQRKEAVFDAASEVTAQNRAALNAAASVNRRKEPIFAANVAGNVRKEGVTNLRDPVNNKDGAVLNAAGSFNRRKEAVLSADIAFNEKKEAVTNSSRDGAAVLNGGGSFNGRKEVALDADIKVNGRKEAVINSKNEAALSTGGDREVPYKERWVPPPLRSSVQKQQVQPEPRDIHVIPTIRNGRRVSTTAEETENVEPAYDNKAKGNYTDVLKDDWSKTPKVRQNGIHKDWLNGTAWARSPVGQEEPGLIGLESQSAAPVVSRDVKAVNMVPPHKQTVDDSPVYDDDIPRAVNKLLDPSVHEARPSLPMRSKDARPISLIPPPYTKPHLRKASTLPDDSKLTDEPIKSYIAVDYEKSDIGDRGKPVSVRRRIPKPALGIETEHTTTPSRRLLNGDLYDAEVADRWERKEKVGVADRRQHEVKRLDVEEEAMDRLLAHYSKKGTSNEPSRRTRTKPPPVEPAKDQSTAESLRYRPERVASLPPELTTPVVEGGVGRRPVRTTSLQPDSMSPNGGRLHPRLPDYDDLAARFIALKHG
ncbi:uncharacterized protein A4U43_C08F15930 [Asparagus officinalis]|uniref:uncharacterized protein LOC109819684 n=1 Tax=Asparagus officinalis TaxID=4686 RepID=UPI00098DE76F|nr:uncharacterized protein LOC109819684 [Asparagus officinalis]ONK60244.1 uncharacterized protein A4U43_C08F15930 [Asparagus officinalis]